MSLDGKQSPMNDIEKNRVQEEEEEDVSSIEEFCKRIGNLRREYEENQKKIISCENENREFALQCANLKKSQREIIERCDSLRSSKSSLEIQLQNLDIKYILLCSELNTIQQSFHSYQELYFSKLKEVEKKRTNLSSFLTGRQYLTKHEWNQRVQLELENTSKEVHDLQKKHNQLNNELLNFSQQNLKLENELKNMNSIYEKHVVEDAKIPELEIKLLKLKEEKQRKDGIEREANKDLECTDKKFLELQKHQEELKSKIKDIRQNMLPIARRKESALNHQHARILSEIAKIDKEIFLAKEQIEVFHLLEYEDQTINPTAVESSNDINDLSSYSKIGNRGSLHNSTESNVISVSPEGMHQDGFERTNEHSFPANENHMNSEGNQTIDPFCSKHQNQTQVSNVSKAPPSIRPNSALYKHFQRAMNGVFEEEK